MPPSDREIELKFDLEPGSAKPVGQLLQLWSGEAGPPADEELVSVYYDTPERALRDGGLSLRLRREGGRWLQTAKSGQGSSFARGEWEREVVGEALDPAALGDTPLKALLKNGSAQTLAPAFTVRVKRTRRTIRDGAYEVEASLDRGTVEADGRSQPLCELELELKSGDPDGLFGLARTLGESEPLRLAFQTKAERGYALLEGKAETAVKAGRSAVRPGQTAGEALQAIGRQCLAQLSANERLLRDTRGSEALHQARVALRRFRGALSQFRDLAADARLEGVKAELKWLAKELDDARNIDVFLEETFAPAAKLTPDALGLAQLEAAIGKRRDRAYDRACEALGSPRYRALVLDTAQWLETGDWTRADGAAAERRQQPVEAYAAAALDRLTRKIKKRGRGLAKMDAEARHELRIAGKKLRYAAEFFVEAVKGRRRAAVRRLLETLKPLQDILGQLNDLATGRALAADLAAAAPAPARTDVGITAGVLLGRREAGEGALLEKLAKAWARFEKV